MFEHPRPTASLVQYSEPLSSSEGYLFVRRVDNLEAIPAAAVTIQAIMRQAYISHFSQGNRPLIPENAISEYFADTTPQIEALQDRMLTAMKKGSQYWMASLAQSVKDQHQAVAFVKTSPSRPGLRQWTSPNLFVNELDVLPEYQSRGIGTATLRTAMLYGGYASEQKVAAHLYDVKPTDHDLLRQTGLQKVRDIEPFELGNYPIPQALYASNDSNTLREIIWFLGTKSRQFGEPEDISRP